MHQSPTSQLIRVFISYAHGDPEHETQVRRFWNFLCEQGINAQIDLTATVKRQDWTLWTLREIRSAQFILVMASPEYKRRAEGDAPPNTGRGVQWEATLIRQEVYADYEAALERFLPVVLPTCSVDDIPQWLGPTATTHYKVSDYTVEGAETLLRVLTNQPYDIQPTLGSVPRLPPRLTKSTPESKDAPLITLLNRLADRSTKRNESLVQADVRQLLLLGPFGLDEDDLRVETEDQIVNRRRIVLDPGSAVIEVRDDLRKEGVLTTTEIGLANYLRERYLRTNHRCVGILTDGAEWLLYQHLDDKLRDVAVPLRVDPSAPKIEEVTTWLESILATGKQIIPSPREVIDKLGAKSPSYALEEVELTAIYTKYRDLPTVQVKRALWAKLLTTAQGTNFVDDDSLFVNHTLLVSMAKVVGHAVVGIRPDDARFTAATIMSGALFSDAHIGGVIEADFFDWIAQVPGGDRFVKALARRLNRFAWEHVQHDVMKVLYESIISPETRHRLGEYYTPDWLAEEIVTKCVTDPLDQQVLDPACGSGTFLFHAIRRYITAAESTGGSNADVIHGVVKHVMGIDVHPVAVTLARVTYLLALGMDRLRAEGRPEFSVPVYLGDSLRWGQELTLFSYEGLTVPTDYREIYVDFLGRPEHDELTLLRFPDAVLADAEQFDRMVAELANLAAQRERGSPIPSLGALFHRFQITDEDRFMLEKTFKRLCSLHDQREDHIWGYYVRNVARPAWLARPDNRIDVLVSNPPWLAYRYMTKSQQASFRAMSVERGLWSGAAVATHQDLSALFLVRCIELYLRPGGRFGYVMPLATLSRRQYAGFRTGRYPVQSEPVKVSFERPWDLHRIKPAFFPLPPGVVFGRRTKDDLPNSELSQIPEVWSGRFATETASRAQASASIARTIGEPAPQLPLQRSPYATRFSQGASVVPRFLFLIENDVVGPLGVGGNRRAVRSFRSLNEKKPWRDLGSLHGKVERQFIRPLYLGDSVLPFRCLQPRLVVIPWDGTRLLGGEDEKLDFYPGLAHWWRSAEDVWYRHRASHRLSLLEQLDYRGKLSEQFPAPLHRVVYGASGMYLAACIISDTAAIIDSKLYWGPARSLDEARFLTAVLNSNTLTMAVRPLQSRGEHNPRDFHKNIFRLPIPLYNASDTSHRSLVAYAERSEQIALRFELPEMRFESQRRRIREELVKDGVAADTEAIVKELLIV